MCNQNIISNKFDLNLSTTLSSYNVFVISIPDENAGSLQAPLDHLLPQHRPTVQRPQRPQSLHRPGANAIKLSRL